MANIDNLRPMASGTLFGGRPASGFSNFLGKIAAWNDTRSTRKALSKLTDRELNDIGLSFGDIDLIRISR